MAPTSDAARRHKEAAAKAVPERQIPPPGVEFKANSVKGYGRLGDIPIRYKRLGRNILPHESTASRSTVQTRAQSGNNQRFAGVSGSHHQALNDVRVPAEGPSISAQYATHSDNWKYPLFPENIRHHTQTTSTTKPETPPAGSKRKHGEILDVTNDDILPQPKKQEAKHTFQLPQGVGIAIPQAMKRKHPSGSVGDDSLSNGHERPRKKQRQSGSGDQQLRTKTKKIYRGIHVVR